MRTDAYRVALWLVVLPSLALGLARGALAQDGTPPGAAPGLHSEVQGDNRRESEITTVPANGDEPQISFIDSPTAACFQPDPAQDVCYVNWYYMSVSASPDYIVWMMAEINAIGKVARYSGFFQTSMYVPYNMNGKGFKVACGALGAGGDPEWGNAWAWTLRARDSAGLSSANYGTVYCPAYVP